MECDTEIQVSEKWAIIRSADPIDANARQLVHLFEYI